MDLGIKEIEKALEMLGNELQVKEDEKYSIVICGGAALIITKMRERFTKDIDVLGIIEINNEKLTIKYLNEFPIEFQEAKEKIEKFLNLPTNWINTGPKDLVKFGLPIGFTKRLIKKSYGKNLDVYFSSRKDQICFKLYASVDSGPGRHTKDLLGLKPTLNEIKKAAKWAITQDPSISFKMELKSMLKNIGYNEIAERI